MKKRLMATIFILITVMGSSIILKSYKDISLGHVVRRTYVDLWKSDCTCNRNDVQYQRLNDTSLDDAVLEELAWRSLQRKIAESKLDVNYYQKLELCPEQPPYLVGRLNITENLTLEETTDPESLKRVIFGGRYRPPDCKAREYVAIIIPYRDRKHDLDVQLRLLHQVLQRQQCEYMIFVVEMALPTAFNKGLINNAGFTTAMMINNFSCVIFQDVDAFMMDDRNLYRCGSDPRHYLAYSTKYGDKGLPFPELYGGVIGFTPGQFTKVNGFSNLYFGWGEEDNDLHIRVKVAGLKYVRSGRDVGGYIGFKHHHDATNPEGSAYSLIRNAKARATVEGVGTIRFRRYAVEYRELYTWILIGVEQADITQKYQKWFDYPMKS
ncbi:hypothetical protein CHS0354_011768 [Potamilus streckersoni]|uniref:Beta-1,4-galactosyltransferase n=1 Tax=Potamilus streckersoni TaxID=2493646 RepID=A0AAE0TGG4_9BIVA|nr:hypothetical protein CHS0354_011768 [Potamilus streckersoni]KAK3609937.1 hypothetical protein CHS0354_011768 [Potamilus streckersoni]